MRPGRDPRRVAVAMLALAAILGTAPEEGGPALDLVVVGAEDGQPLPGVTVSVVLAPRKEVERPPVEVTDERATPGSTSRAAPGDFVAISAQEGGVCPRPGPLDRGPGAGWTARLLPPEARPRDDDRRRRPRRAGATDRATGSTRTCRARGIELGTEESTWTTTMAWRPTPSGGGVAR